MKRYIKSSTSRVIFEDELFSFKTRSGVGTNDVHWEGLYVESKGLAKEHVVEIRLNSTNSIKDEGPGDTFKYKYKNAYIAHGMRGVSDTLEDTEDYIYVLQDAVDFAERIDEWLSLNQADYLPD